MFIVRYDHCTQPILSARIEWRMLGRKYVFSTFAVPLIGLDPTICVSHHHFCDSQSHRTIQVAKPLEPKSSTIPTFHRIQSRPLFSSTPFTMLRIITRASTCHSGKARNTRYLSQAPATFTEEKMDKDQRYATTSKIPDNLFKEGFTSQFSIRGKFRDGRAAYLDHSATTPLDPRVLDKMAPFMVRDYVSQNGRPPIKVPDT
jgi:hypothetical protein